MKTIEVALTKKLATEVDNYVKNGWFDDEKEVMRTALQEFIRRHRIELMEKFLREDIAWAGGPKNRNKKGERSSAIPARFCICGKPDRWIC